MLMESMIKLKQNSIINNNLLRNTKKLYKTTSLYLYWYLVECDNTNSDVLYYQYQ